MLKIVTGDLLSAQTEVLVNTVNTVGVMGKGIALQFKRKFPENYRVYAKACKNGEVKIGEVLTVPLATLDMPQYIINFPTKKHWRQPSKLEYVQSGLVSLVAEIQRLGVTSVAIPPLGCGHGGLAWKEVLPLIEEAFQPLQNLNVLVFAPSEAEHVEKPNTTKPKLTRVRALLIHLLHDYLLPGYSAGKVEIQKLVYFLKETGEDLPKLEFTKHQFGPYDPAINHVLERLEGHYISGLGDGGSKAEVQLLPDAQQEAQEYLKDDESASKALERVQYLIEGFETPFGMELLATVHWVATREGANTVEKALDLCHSWNEGKRQRFQSFHVRVAWERLKEDGWI